MAAFWGGETASCFLKISGFPALPIDKLTIKACTIDDLGVSWLSNSCASTPPGCSNQASRFQIIKVHVERTEVSEDKEGIEEMELAATNSDSLEAWLSTIEVSCGMTNADCSITFGEICSRGWVLVALESTSLRSILTTSTILNVEKRIPNNWNIQENLISTVDLYNRHAGIRGRGKRHETLKRCY